MTVTADVVTAIASSTRSIAEANTPLVIILFGIGIAFYFGKYVKDFFPKS